VPTSVQAAAKAHADVLLLSKDSAQAFSRHLDEVGGIPYPLSGSVLMGALAVQRDILERAARITDVFHRTCRSIHAEMQSDDALREMLLRPLTPLPTVRDTVFELPFFLRFLRMDFFLDGKGNLRIIEVNSGGAGLTDYLRCVRWLRGHYDFVPPRGFGSMEVEDMLRCITEHARAMRPGMKVFGFVPVENGREDQLMENLEYAQWIKEHTDLMPALFLLTKGVLEPYDHPEAPARDLCDVDAMLVDWFEDLPCLERVERQLQEHNILEVPPRSDLLFENKHFLSILRRLKRPKTIPEEGWTLLQEALLPSFPLEELTEHLDEVRRWPGVVLKMDIDCASENVFLYDFDKKNCSNVFKELQIKSQQLKIDDPTWTLQQFMRPPRLPLNGKRTPPWVEYPYEPYRYDLMTYFCSCDQQPHVLFGSREFSTEKVDDLTEEGRDDNIFGAVCAL
jgi:hypothetical protein